MSDDNQLPSFGKMALYGIGAVALIAVGTVTINLITAPARLANMAVNSATGVVSKTLDPNNVITRYEWFHDANGTFNLRISQIAIQKGAVANEKDASERSRLNVELRGLQASCLKLANEYNANATKTNVSIFQGRDAPTNLNPQECN